MGVPIGGDNSTAFHHLQHGGHRSCWAGDGDMVPESNKLCALRVLSVEYDVILGWELRFNRNGWDTK